HGVHRIRTHGPAADFVTTPPRTRVLPRLGAIVLSVATISLTSCRHSPPAPHYIAPEPRPVPGAARLRELMSELPKLEGAFTEPDHVYALIADHRPIAEIASADTAAIPLLVECLRDERPARIQFLGQRVSVGMVCAYTLVETEYVSHHLQFSCFPQDWH